MNTHTHAHMQSTTLTGRAVAWKQSQQLRRIQPQQQGVVGSHLRHTHAVAMTTNTVAMATNTVVMTTRLLVVMTGAGGEGGAEREFAGGDTEAQGDPPANLQGTHTHTHIDTHTHMHTHTHTHTHTHKHTHKHTHTQAHERASERVSERVSGWTIHIQTSHVDRVIHTRIQQYTTHICTHRHTQTQSDTHRHLQ